MKMMKLWMLVVVATIASACSKQDDAGFEGAATKTVQFIATDAAGRTIFGTPEEGVYPVLWQAEDKISVSLNMCDRVSATALNLINDGTSVTFKASYPEDEATNAAEKTFYAVVPNAGISSFYNKKDSDDPRFIIKVVADQTPLANSCDPKVQVLYAQSAAYTTIPEQVEMSFKHWCAYGCMTIKNLNTTEPIAKVQLSVDSYLAGSTYWRPTAENEVDRLYNNGGSPAPKNPEKTITLNTSSVENPLWFAALPVDLSGEEMTIRVTLENGDTYTKTITFANGDGNFQAGRIAKFAVNFADVEKDVVAEPFELLEVYKESGVAQGIVFWVSDDGQTAKIVSLDRLEKAAWASQRTSSNTIKESGTLADEDGAVNTETIGKFLADPEYSTITSAPYNYVTGKGSGWYWPTRAELWALAAAYNGKPAYSDVTKDTNVSDLPEDERNAQIEFDALLTDNGGVALCGSDTGDSYWSSLASSTKAFYVTLGLSTSAKTSDYQNSTVAYTRAIKVVTK